MPPVPIPDDCMTLVAMGFVTYLLNKVSGASAVLNGRDFALRIKDDGRAIAFNSSVKLWCRNVMPSNVFMQDGKIMIFEKDSGTSFWLDDKERLKTVRYHHIMQERDDKGRFSSYEFKFHMNGQSIFWRTRDIQDC